MRVHVRLLGTLPEHYPANYPDTGFDAEVWKNISVAELVELVQIAQKHVGLVTINGMLAKADDVIPDGAEVKFFQSISGG
jgi:hypothetical protein